MAITVVHQPVGSGGLAAYAAGRGRAQQRERKYATDLVLNQQARRDRYNLLQQQQQFSVGLERQRQGFTQARDVQQQKYNLAGIKERNLGYADRELKADTRRNQYNTQRDARRALEGRVHRLPQLPDNAPADLQRRLMGYQRSMEDLLSHDIDLTDEGNRQRFYEQEDLYMDAYGSKPPADRAAEANSRRYYQGPDGIAYNEPGDPSLGRVAYNADTDKPIDFPEQEEPEDPDAELMDLYREKLKGNHPKTGEPYTPDEARQAALTEYEAVKNFEAERKAERQKMQEIRSAGEALLGIPQGSPQNAPQAYPAAPTGATPVQTPQIDGRGAGGGIVPPQVSATGTGGGIVPPQIDGRGSGGGIAPPMYAAPSTVDRYIESKKAPIDFSGTEAAGISPGPPPGTGPATGPGSWARNRRAEIEADRADRKRKAARSGRKSPGVNITLVNPSNRIEPKAATSQGAPVAQHGGGYGGAGSEQAFLESQGAAVPRSGAPGLPMPPAGTFGGPGNFEVPPPGGPGTYAPQPAATSQPAAAASQPQAAQVQQENYKKGPASQEQGPPSTLHSIDVATSDAPWAKGAKKNGWKGEYPQAPYAGKYYPRPTSKEQFEALDDGTVFIGPNGKPYTKGERLPKKKPKGNAYHTTGMGTL